MMTHAALVFFFCFVLFSYLWLIYSSFDASGGMCVVVVVLSKYLHVHFLTFRVNCRLRRRFIRHIMSSATSVISILRIIGVYFRNYYLTY